MASSKLDFSHLPPTFILPASLTPSQISSSEASLRAHGCPLASISTATLFFGNVGTAKRSALELRGHGIQTEPQPAPAPIRVVKLKWIADSIAAGKSLPFDKYTIFSASIISRTPPQSPVKSKEAADEERRKGILERAKMDAKIESDRLKNDRLRYTKNGRDDRSKRGNVEDILASNQTRRTDTRPTTPEFESAIRKKRKLADMPEWVKKKIQYSCCRPTPLNSPNHLFLTHLSTIRLSRILTNSQVYGYSTLIASLRSYPYPLITPAEIMLLPGCSTKTASLFTEWMRSDPNPEKRTLSVTTELNANKPFKILRTFATISGSAEVARDWFENHSWETVDDVVKFGWGTLERGVQVRVKYWEEFTGVTRAEAEKIEHVVRRYAGTDAQCMLAGAYRRGEETMDEVELLVSRLRGVDREFLDDLVEALNTRGFLTCEVSSGRYDGTDASDDAGIPNDPVGGHILYAQIVWQEPSKDRKSKIKNPHRIVKIVVAPPECVGSALVAMTGGETYLRDLALWCEKERGWRWDAAGVMGPGEHREIDGCLKEGEGMVDAEKRLLERLGVGWREAGERCTW